MPDKIITAFEAVRLYSVASTAGHLDVSETYVRKQIKDGALRAVELGSTRAKTRVRADDLQRFIDQRTFPKGEHDG